MSLNKCIKIFNISKIFNKHEFKDLEFVAIEKVDLVNGENANNPLLTREAYWMAQLCTVSPYGLNKRSELRSKNRIHYKL